MLDAILFDLDGTLLPMDNDVFTKGYLSLLSRAIAPHGYEPREMLSAMWYGVEAMVRNDGKELNCDAFLRAFAERLGDRVYDDIRHFDAFYLDGFGEARRLPSRPRTRGSPFSWRERRRNGWFWRRTLSSPPLRSRQGWIGRVSASRILIL